MILRLSRFNRRIVQKYMKIRILAQTDIGLERFDNEDAFIFCPALDKQIWDESPDRYIYNGQLGTLAVIADGMGGENAGETASKIAIDAIKSQFNPTQIETAVHSTEAVCGFLEKVILNANKAIMKRVELDPATIGMGTTIVLLWLIENKAYIAWCGDSRCYVFNPKNGLTSLSKDHSLVQELIDKGELSVDGSFNHPDNSIVTRCLGDLDVSNSPEVRVYDVCSNDTFVLCSDGLCGYCKDKTIEKTLYSSMSNLGTCCQALMDLALKAGGHDNITILLLSVVDDNKNKIASSIWSRWKKRLGL